MILFDSQAGTAWTASLEPMELLVCKIAFEAIHKALIILFD
jgi:hypothetical protein